ncbi:MAG TPA: sigma-54 dependent transcriptional regulator [Thermoanaerobaculia bacterium]|nr:sigma-54 dependent transcriptional regulator [Thermoanaerobaculia bacterium]
MSSTPQPARPRALIADDQREVREALRLLLKAEGFEAVTASSAAEVVQQVTTREFDVVLIDLNYSRDTTSGREGLDLLARLRQIDDALPVVVMTAWASIDIAVAAMRQGARDFVEKPWENQRLLAILRTQVELSRALRRGELLSAENELLRGSRPRLIAEAPEMRPVLELVARVGPSQANVLITGENGTGKGLVARALHAASPRAAGAMVTVNTGGLSEAVFESELFGHVRGAFTDAKEDRVGRFELADGGTIFLDEISNITLHQQARLLRVIETGEFERLGSSRTRSADVRILSATNADLGQEVAAGRFRQDLLFRLNTVEITVPPLRTRRSDIMPLAEHFLAQHNQRYRKRLRGFSEGAAKALLGYQWPGNVRELDHAVERGVLMAGGERLRPEDLGLRPETAAVSGRLEELPLEEVEKVLIEKALARYGGSVSQAAHALGLSRSALYRRLEKHGI